MNKHDPFYAPNRTNAVIAAENEKTRSIYLGVVERRGDMLKEDAETLCKYLKLLCANPPIDERTRKAIEDSKFALNEALLAIGIMEATAQRIASQPKLVAAE